MEVVNHKEGVPFEYYVNLFKGLDPDEATVRTGCPFDGQAFTVTLLGVDYRICWPEYAISAADPGAIALHHLPTQTFLLRWLLEGRNMAAIGTFKSCSRVPPRDPSSAQ